MQQKRIAESNPSLTLKVLLLVALVSGSSLALSVARAAEGDGSADWEATVSDWPYDGRHHGYIAQPGWLHAGNLTGAAVISASVVSHERVVGDAARALYVE